MRRMALAGCLAGLLLLWATAVAAAETVSLGSDQDTSNFPFVFLAPADLERAESFQISVTAFPLQALEYEQYVSCRRGSESVGLQSPDLTVAPPFSASILPTIPDPDSCWIAVSAAASIDSGIAGTVRIEASGNRRPAPATVLPPPPPPPPSSGHPSLPEPAWVTCSPPAWLRSGRTKSFGESCGRASVIATRAWHRPARAGKTVTSGGFSCRRSQRGNAARVRCTKGSAIVLVAGQLR